MNRKLLLRKIISLALVVAFFAGDIAWASPEQTISRTTSKATLAPHIRVSTFFAKDGLDFKTQYGIYNAVCILKNLAADPRAGSVTINSKINHLNQLYLADALIKIDADAGMRTDFLGGNMAKDYKYVYLNFNNGKQIKVAFLGDHSRFTRGELEELGIKNDKDREWLDYPGLKDVWFVKPEGDADTIVPSVPAIEENAWSLCGFSLRNGDAIIDRVPGRCSVDQIIFEALGTHGEWRSADINAYSNITVTLPANARHIILDKEKFELVTCALWHLVQNAIKYSEALDPDPWIGIRIAYDDDGHILTIEISDNCIGIPANEIADIVDLKKIYRASNASSIHDYGIGFNVSHAVVRKKLGGTVTLVGELNMGTKVTVTIPDIVNVRPTGMNSLHIAEEARADTSALDPGLIMRRVHSASDSAEDDGSEGRTPASAEQPSTISAPVVTIDPAPQQGSRHVGGIRSEDLPTPAQSRETAGAVLETRTESARSVVQQQELPNIVSKYNFLNWRMRLFDIVVSASFLVVLSPIILIAVPIYIKCISGGPIWFLQKRCGYKGNDVWVLKFCTMHDGVITRAGQLLRDKGIDEFPQFWNVLRGQMSFFGPRPLWVDLDLDKDSNVKKYLSIVEKRRPGLLDLFSVLVGPGKGDYRFTITYYLARYEIEHWSLSFAVKLLWCLGHCLLVDKDDIEYRIRMMMPDVQESPELGELVREFRNKRAQRSSQALALDPAGDGTHEGGMAAPDRVSGDGAPDGAPQLAPKYRNRGLACGTAVGTWLLYGQAGLMALPLAYAISYGAMRIGWLIHERGHEIGKPYGDAIYIRAGPVASAIIFLATLTTTAFLPHDSILFATALIAAANYVIHTLGDDEVLIRDCIPQSMQFAFPGGGGSLTGIMSNVLMMTEEAPEGASATASSPIPTDTVTNPDPIDETTLARILTFLSDKQRAYITSDPTRRRADRILKAHKKFEPSPLFDNPRRERMLARAAFILTDLQEAVDMLTADHASAGLTEFSASDVARAMMSYYHVTDDANKYTTLNQWMSKMGLAYEEFHIRPGLRSVKAVNIRSFHFAQHEFTFPAAVAGKIKAVGNTRAPNAAEMTLIDTDNSANMLVIKNSRGVYTCSFVDPATHETICDSIEKQTDTHKIRMHTFPAFIRFMDTVLDIPSDFVPIETESPRSQAIMEWLVANGSRNSESTIPDSGVLHMGRTILHLPEYYANNRGVIHIYRDQEMYTRRMCIIDAVNPANYVVFELRRIDGVDRIVSSHTGEVLPARPGRRGWSVSNLSTWPPFRKFDDALSKLGGPLKLEPSSASLSRIAFGQARFSFDHAVTLTYRPVVKAEGAIRTHRTRRTRDDFSLYPIELVRPDGKTIEIRQYGKDAARYTVSGLTWRATGAPVVFVRTPGHTSFNLSVVAELVRKTAVGTLIQADDLFLDTFRFVLREISSHAPQVNAYRIDPVGGTITVSPRGTVTADQIETEGFEIVEAPSAVEAAPHPARTGSTGDGTHEGGMAAPEEVERWIAAANGDDYKAAVDAVGKLIAHVARAVLPDECEAEVARIAGAITQADMRERFTDALCGIRIRRFFGWSKKDLAKVLGVKHATVFEWGGGSYHIPVKQLQRIKRFFARNAGIRVKCLCTFFGWRPDDFAKKLGIGQTVVSDWENGVSIISEEDLQKITKFFMRHAAARVICLRKFLGWSQNDLAEKLGVNQNYVARWEKGSEISGKDLEKITECFTRHIGIYVRCLCTFFGWRPDDFAEKLGIDQTAEFGWEDYGSAISEENLRRIPEFFARVAGDRVRCLRRFFEWSQEDLAEILGVNQVDVSRWENGSVPRSLEWLEKIVKLYEQYNPGLAPVPADAGDFAVGTEGLVSQMAVASSAVTIAPAPPKKGPRQVGGIRGEDRPNPKQVRAAAGVNPGQLSVVTNDKPFSMKGVTGDERRGSYAYLETKEGHVEIVDSEAKRINKENKAHLPRDIMRDKNKVLCHIVMDEVVPPGQLKLLEDLKNEMRAGRFSEKIVRFNPKKDSAEFATELAAFMEDRRSEYEGCEVEFDIACPNTTLVETIRDKVGIRALAFECKKEEGADVVQADVVQVESIILALRVFREESLSGSGSVEVLKRLYKFLTNGEEPSPEKLAKVKQFADFALEIAFVLPVAKVPIKDLPRANQLMKEYIESAA